MMRRVKTDESGNDGSPRRVRRNKTTQPVGRIAPKHRRLALCFLGFMGLFLFADLVYLYNLSSNPTSSLGSTIKQKLRKNPSVVKNPPISNALDSEELSHHQHEEFKHHLQQPPREDPELQRVQSETLGQKSSISNDKEPIFAILKQAEIERKDLNQETIDALPNWSDVQKLFGDGPRIHGLERCQEFRDSTDPTVRFFGIAGTFNTGTNLLAELMIQNCQITERMLVYGNQSKGIRWQVPWGKHYPASQREAHYTDTDATVPFNHSLPLVTIRDPYTWMQSMCRHEYAAKWKHSKDHCPNLVPTQKDLDKFPHLRGKDLVPVEVKYTDGFSQSHKSLAHFWSDWYALYYYNNNNNNVHDNDNSSSIHPKTSPFPRIIVRFEDLLFYGQQVTETLCTCGGGVPREDRPKGSFRHISESAKLGTKSHGKHKTDLVGALIKYGNQDHRFDNVTSDDLNMAKQLFDPTLMETFGYSHP